MYGILKNTIKDSIRAYYSYVNIQKLGFNPDDLDFVEKLTNQIIKKIEKNVENILTDN